MNDEMIDAFYEEFHHEMTKHNKEATKVWLLLLSMKGGPFYVVWLYLRGYIGEKLVQLFEEQCESNAERLKSFIETNIMARKECELRRPSKRRKN